MKKITKKELKKIISKTGKDLSTLLYEGIIKEKYIFKATYEYNGIIKKYNVELDTDDMEVAYKECRFLYGLSCFRELDVPKIKYVLIKDVA